MSWTVYSVNNATREYKIRRASGEKVTVNVPLEHRDPVNCRVYIAATQDAHEAFLMKPLAPRLIKPAILIALGSLAIYQPHFGILIGATIIAVELISTLKILRDRRK